MAFSFKRILGSLSTSRQSPAKAIGIDIGSSAVKIVELEQSERAPILKTYGEIQLGPYQERAIGELVDFDAEILKKAIVDLFREAGATAEYATLALPLTSGFVTVIDVVVNEETTVESRIPVEARKYVPLPLKDVTLDWTNIGEVVVREDGSQIQKVLLVALQNESVVAYNQLLREIELPQQPLELAVFSAARAAGEPSTPTAFIDCGASVTRLFIFNEGTLHRIHRFLVGGAQVTSKLATLRSLDLSAAESHKRNLRHESDVATDTRSITHALYGDALAEIRRTLQQYEQEQEVQFSGVILMGGVANTAGFADHVSDQLQREVTRSFPFAQVAYPAFMEDVLREIGPVFHTSLGAALRMFR